ncbi:hypothetical protein [Dokdonia sp. Hel_I_53]|uniref:hypothetical protein n=1 Tax=Dokdonia sp. Hel_I_53 TaxID=1566287 RepID=UPI001198EA12|nr:hypothetical protein [Dokdonia sp. Hel_I_53]TVZ50938.1 hypothetical protein OD90_0071 [Dokdonia sp. Hel_I_53]
MAQKLINIRILYTLVLLISIISASSCRNDFETTESTGNLEFSRDTVYLDTVFTNIGSSTFNLKVYNRSDDAISIPSVQLGNGENSNYRLNVDGVPGRVFENVEILAKDSIFIFIETTLDINQVGDGNNEFLYTDVIEFNSAGAQQRVALVTLVKDAIFLFPERDGATGIIETLDVNGVETSIEGRYLLDDELIFTNEKPYVVYGYVAVGDPENGTAKTLTIDAGARIHFHADSGLLIADNATLAINGSLSADQEALENEVILESDRLETVFSEVPGQWGTILLTDGSVNNTINYATIKNATVGILNESNTDTGIANLTLSNTQIYNASAVGLLNRFSNVNAFNTIINNCGQFSMLIQLGGSYDFTHCTFANYWTGSFRNTPSVFLDNSLTASETLFVGDLTSANFTNCIIYGNQENEIGFNKEEGALFNYKFSNTQLRFDDIFGNFENDPLYDFSNTGTYENVIRGGDPDFLNPELNKLQVGENTSGNNLGLPAGAIEYPLDLIGTTRSNSPDFGAYESIIFPD